MRIRRLSILWSSLLLGGPWTAHSFQATVHRSVQKPSNLFSSSPEEAEKLREQAQKLRQEVESFQQEKTAAEQEELRQKQEQQEEAQARRERYSAIVPILKANGSVVQERCDFSPRWKDEGASYITVVESSLPLGIILGESDDFAGAISVDEVGEESNGGMAGLQPGDLLRALTACRVEMVQPTWQLVVGGIGQPKTVRFMYSVDNRPFEEVMEAIGSNRMDPEERKILLVVERREKQ